ncbi:MAG: DUF2490 domain-containing protein [Sinomicrobium sp.]|nr:DUF2490 domain-containing protein [Sinomicrobium sp.]
MQRYIALTAFGIFTLLSPALRSQVDEGKAGAWYIYSWSAAVKESAWGVQGDVQYRNWNIIGDLEQLLLRGGITYKPGDAQIKFAIGYAYTLSGEFGDGNATRYGHRIYQEALLTQQLGERFYLGHRFRYEQRFVEGQDFRTRWRYNFSLTIPLNQNDLQEGAVYIAFYNELFINGERNTGNGNTVALFDRDRIYGALGYSLTGCLRVQLGYMQQITDSWKKGQLQLSVHHVF